MYQVAITLYSERELGDAPIAYDDSLGAKKRLGETLQAVPGYGSIDAFIKNEMKRMLIWKNMQARDFELTVTHFRIEDHLRDVEVVSFGIWPKLNNDHWWSSLLRFLGISRTKKESIDRPCHEVYESFVIDHPLSAQAIDTLYELKLPKEDLIYYKMSGKRIPRSVDAIFDKGVLHHNRFKLSEYLQSSNEIFGTLRKHTI